MEEKAVEKILIVDDDDAVRGMIKMRLSDTYETIDTGNPVQALGLALEHKPRAILLDLMMPEMDGFEFLRELRKQPAFVDVPVIVVTAKDLTEEDIRVLNGQTEGIIAKDQTYLTELAAAVRGRLARQPAREAGPVAI
jgi:DNA-binding response OmpR family regulator